MILRIQFPLGFIIKKAETKIAGYFYFDAMVNPDGSRIIPYSGKIPMEKSEEHKQS